MREKRSLSVELLCPWQSEKSQITFSCCWMEYNTYMLHWFILDFEIIWTEDTFKLVTWKYVRISTKKLRKMDSWEVYYLIRILETSSPCMLDLKKKKNSKHFLKSYFCHEHLTSVTSQANGNNSKQPFFHPVQRFIITHLQVQNEGQTAESYSKYCEKFKEKALRFSLKYHSDL